MKITPNLLDNLGYSDFVRGSREDFEVLYKKDSDSDIYKLTITSDVGATLFRVTIQKHDPMFANAESLYNTILSNVPTGIESIDSILDEINKK